MQELFEKNCNNAAALKRYMQKFMGNGPRRWGFSATESFSCSLQIYGMIRLKYNKKIYVCYILLNFCVVFDMMEHRK